ncbi:MAG: 50S ribosomal protein L25 [Dehalococcoidia bacterium]|nr:50S ribosomal protein L25 [Dehalococcoidia bacterium]
MSPVSIEVRRRAITGKHNRFLRRAGITPANLYGAGIESLSLQVETKALLKTLAATSRNTPIELRVVGDSSPKTAFIWKIQRDPVSEQVVHADFYHVDPSRKMRAFVPVILENISSTLEKLDFRVVLILERIEVESLPADLPAEFHLDASSLLHLDDALRVSDLPVIEKVTLHAEPNAYVARVLRIIHKVEVVETPVAEATAAVPTAGDEAKKAAEAAAGEEGKPEAKGGGKPDAKGGGKPDAKGGGKPDAKGGGKPQAKGGGKDKK